MNNYLAIFSLGKNKNGQIGITIKWEELEVIIGKGIKVISIFLIMYFIIKIGNKIIDRFIARQVESKLSFSMNEQKAITIGAVLKSALKYGVYISGAALIIGTLFSGVSAAVLGVGGFAVGIGAQSLVKDLINGFFILFEDQYGVGDHITLGPYTGIVEDIGIRTTVLRDFTGDIHIVPNGSILEVTNHSRGDIRFLVDVEVAYEEDPDNAIKVITSACNKFKKKNEEEIRGDIEVLGVISLNASGITIRVIGRAKPLSQWKMERDLRKEIKVALDEAGIEIPYPKTQLINSKN